MKEKTCVVTGGNSGIGKATAIALAKMDHKVVIVCRNAGKGEAALADIRKKSGSDDIELVIGNLDSIENTKALACILSRKYPELAVLVNNAGVWMTKKTMTADGLEYSFQVNHMAPFILSVLLLPTLKKNAPARIVNVNAGLYVKGALDLKATPYGGDFHLIKTYMNSKLCNAMFTRELAKAIEGSGVTVNALHPGVIRTRLGNTPGLTGFFLRAFKLFWGSPKKGADAPVWLATAPEVEKVNGRFFMLRKETPYAGNAANDRLTHDLWQLSTELSGVAIPV
jgi:NAD(P)-dependent dehydrogenase (short-subunit alcohol dehydrogenase family)